MLPGKHRHSRTGPDAELGPETAAVDAALDEWRHKAADVVLIAAAVTHLPVVILLMLGHGAPMAWWLRDTLISLYVVVVAVALFRTVNYRTRLFVFFVVLYVAVAIASFANPHGPYSQVGLITVPSLVLVFLGNRPAAVAIGASAALVPSAALLRASPGVMHTLGFGSSYAPSAVAQTAVLALWLIGLMLPLGRFARFLLNSLAAQYRAKAEMEREVAERTAAQSKVEREMRERQRLEREIASLSDEERRRLGRELHDGVCQQVTAVLLRCQVLEQRLKRGQAVSGADFAPLLSLLADTMDDAHNVARGLCPLEPHPDALAPALRAMAKRMQEVAGVRCEFRAVGDVRVPDAEAAQHLYRIAQEALSNAVRHARPSRIAVELRGGNGELTLQVEDDGAGMPAVAPAGGMGLHTMAYRAKLIDGELTVNPAPGSGTRVTCHVPLSTRAPAAGNHA